MAVLWIVLRGKGADARYHAPYVPIIRHNGFELAGEPDLDAILRLRSRHGSWPQRLAQWWQTLIRTMIGR